MQDNQGMKGGIYADLQAALPGVDVRAGMTRVMGDRERYLSLLEKFSTRFAGFAQTLQQHLDNGDMEKAVIEAHSLKGIAASLGAADLQQAAKELERQLRQDEEPTAGRRVEQQLNALMQNIKGLDIHKTTSPPVPSCDSAGNGKDFESQWRQGLEQLLSPLHKLQVRRVKVQLQSLQEQIRTPEQRRQFDALERMTREYKFKEAAAAVEDMLRKC
jgi:HPt (histidine-containing phosphotransfer) domain-containing protein